MSPQITSSSIRRQGSSTFSYAHEGSALELPCLRIDELVIWGLTYRMFQSLAGLL
ncbi:MAG: hypothetical protein ACHP85_11630 [Burkholderiales bacterium]